MEHSMAERLKELEAFKTEARVAGGEKAIERHHAKGRMTARERLEYLLDEDSFQELDMLNRHVASGMGLEDSRPYSDAVSYTHLRAHETGRNLVCRLLLEKKKKQ